MTASERLRDQTNVSRGDVAFGKLPVVVRVRVDIELEKSACQKPRSVVQKNETQSLSTTDRFYKGF
jgi:hypothetical protein